MYDCVCRMRHRVSIPYCSVVVKYHEFFIRSCVRYDDEAYVSDVRPFILGSWTFLECFVLLLLSFTQL